MALPVIPLRPAIRDSNQRPVRSVSLSFAQKPKGQYQQTDLITYFNNLLGREGAMTGALFTITRRGTR